MQPTEALKTPRLKLNPPPGPDTDAWRILHDPESGLWVDSLAGRWLVQTEGGEFPETLLGLAEGRARSVYWRPRDKAAATAPERRGGEPVAERFLVREGGASYWMDFSAGYSSGLFLDQRLNRARVAERSGPGRRILNTFAYTGGFSLRAALAGASTTSVDLSRPCLDWMWDNFAANGLEREGHFAVRGDTFEWLRSFARKGRRFHGVVLDPPTFSRHGRKTFRTDRDYADLADLAAALVEPGGWMLCCANTHRLPRKRFESDLRAGLARARRRLEAVESLPMPPEFQGDGYLKSLWLELR